MLDPALSEGEAMTSSRILAPLALFALVLALLSCEEPDSWTVVVNNTGGAGSSSGGFTGTASGVTAMAGGGPEGLPEEAASSWISLPLSADEPAIVDLWELPDPAGGPSAFVSVEIVAPGALDLDARVAILEAPEGAEPRLTAPPPWESVSGALVEYSGILGDPGSRWWIETLETKAPHALALAILPEPGLVLELIGPIEAFAAHRPGFLELCASRAE